MRPCRLLAWLASHDLQEALEALIPEGRAPTIHWMSSVTCATGLRIDRVRDSYSCKGWV